MLFHSSHHPWEVSLAQFSLYVGRGGLKSISFYFISLDRFSSHTLPIWFRHTAVEDRHLEDIKYRNMSEKWSVMLMTHKSIQTCRRQKIFIYLLKDRILYLTITHLLQAEVEHFDGYIVNRLCST